MNKCCKCGKEVDIFSESFTTISTGLTDLGWEKVNIICEDCEQEAKNDH